jgi:hypothetical protein
VKSLAKVSFLHCFITGLWAGYETAILLSVSPALTFYLSHVITRAVIPKASRESPSSLQTFFVNAAGNTCSTAILFPLILSKTKLQWRSPSGRKMYKSLFDVLRKTVGKYGVKGEFGLYLFSTRRGLLTLLCPDHIIFFATKAYIRD